LSQPDKSNYVENNSVTSLSFLNKSDKYIPVVIILLYIAHIAIFAYHADIYFDHIATGEINAVGPLLGIASDIIMLLGIVLLMFKRYIPILFLFVSAGLFFAGLLLWNQTLSFDMGSFVLVIYGFGFALSMFAWWFANRRLSIHGK
jgi:hypothetical protein